jgi:hypothetical protein
VDGEYRKTWTVSGLLTGSDPVGNFFCFWEIDFFVLHRGYYNNVSRRSDSVRGVVNTGGVREKEFWIFSLLGDFRIIRTWHVTGKSRSFLKTCIRGLVPHPS